MLAPSSDVATATWWKKGPLGSVTGPACADPRVAQAFDAAVEGIVDGAVAGGGLEPQAEATHESTKTARRSFNVSPEPWTTTTINRDCNSVNLKSI